jgi:hypothetical protein
MQSQTNRKCQTLMSDKIMNTYNELNKSKSPENHKPDDSGNESSVSNPGVRTNTTSIHLEGWGR